MGAWRALVAMVVQLPAALDAQLRRDAGISHFEYVVMAWLSEAEDRRLPMSELAHLADGSLSRLSHCVKRLEAKGWIRRSPAPDDGRTNIATLTPAGMAKVVQTAPGHTEAVRRHVFDVLSESEVSDLAAIASRITSTIDGQEGPPK